jgi:iturin family lipopeptide synthetase B
MIKPDLLGKIDSKDIQDIFALTPMQEGLLFHYLKDPDSDNYFEQLGIEVSGHIDIDIFEKAWNFVIQTNEMLRTVYRWEKVEHPVQIVLKEHKIQPGYYDFSNHDTLETASPREQLKTNDRKEKFNLREVPFRVNLGKIENNKYLVLISFHHMLYDGWSSGIILEEFFNTYTALYRGENPGKPQKTKFKEYVKWIRDRDRQVQETYWRNYLTGFDSPLTLSIKKNISTKSTTIPGNRFMIWKYYPVKRRDSWWKSSTIQRCLIRQVKPYMDYLQSRWTVHPTL